MKCNPRLPHAVRHSGDNWKPSMPDDAKKYAELTAKALHQSADKLDVMGDRVFAAANARADITNGKEILKAIADAAIECTEAFEYYEDEDFPLEPVRRAMARVQHSISNTAGAVIAYMAVKSLS